MHGETNRIQVFFTQITRYVQVLINNGFLWWFWYGLCKWFFELVWWMVNGEWWCLLQWNSKTKLMQQLSVKSNVFTCNLLNPLLIEMGLLTLHICVIICIGLSQNLRLKVVFQFPSLLGLTVGKRYFVCLC